MKSYSFFFNISGKNPQLNLFQVSTLDLLQFFIKKALYDLNC